MADQHPAPVAAGHAHSGDDHGGHAHPDAIVQYLFVFTTLMVLTYATVWVSGYTFTNWNAGHVTVAMIVAVIKATLVVLIFMHGWQSSGLVKLVIVTSVLTMMILFGMTYADYSSRNISSIGQEAKELETK